MSNLSTYKYLGDIMYESDDSLEHYGVKGMRWGVRRAIKKLTTTTDARRRASAVSSLQYHRSKGSAEIQKLSTKNVKLQAIRDKQIQTADVKAARLSQRAARTKQKALTRRLMTNKKRSSLKLKAEILQARAESLKARSEKTQAKIDKNESLQKAFQQQIDLIDKTLIENGKRYLGDA